MPRSSPNGGVRGFQMTGALNYSIYVIVTKRPTTRFKVRKALNNKFVYNNLLSLSKLDAYQIYYQHCRAPSKSIVIRRSPKALVKSTLSIKTIATRARAVATKTDQGLNLSVRRECVSLYKVTTRRQVIVNAFNTSLLMLSCIFLFK